MRRLANKTNIDTSTPSVYPYGKIRDDDGSGNGTPVDEQLYGDIHQTFERMFALSGLTANGRPDNLSNGFQLYQALLNTIGLTIYGNTNGAWRDVPVNASVSGGGSLSGLTVVMSRVRTFGKTMHWHVRLTATMTGQVDTITISEQTPSDSEWKNKGGYLLAGIQGGTAVTIAQLSAGTNINMTLRRQDQQRFNAEDSSLRLDIAIVAELQ